MDVNLIVKNKWPYTSSPSSMMEFKHKIKTNLIRKYDKL